jgi:hypothetical protein
MKRDMRKHLTLTLALSAVIALALAGVAGATKTVVRAGNLVLTYQGDISPKKLSKSKQTGISLTIAGKIVTADGTHPPAIRSVVVDTDKHGAVNAKGLATCKAGKLQARDTQTVKRVCKKSIVGSGSTTVEVEFPDQAPFSATGPLVAFNGGTKGGTTTLLIHAYVNVPAPTAIVTTVKIKKRRKGPYGLRSIASVPVIVNGYGSPTAFKLKIGKTFKYKGKKVSYLTAQCATGRFYGHADSKFSDGTHVEGDVVVPCKKKK